MFSVFPNSLMTKGRLINTPTSRYPVFFNSDFGQSQHRWSTQQKIGLRAAGGAAGRFRRAFPALLHQRRVRCTGF